MELRLVAAVYYLTLSPSATQEFQLWKSQFRLMYEGDVRLLEERMIRAHNADKTNTFKMGLNRFAALTQEEFLQLLTRTSKVSQEFIAQGCGLVHQGSGYRVQGPGGLWKLLGVFCNWCPLGIGQMTNGVLRSFSQQQLVDCSRSYGNQSCNGGQQQDGFRYVKDKGIALQTAYPYTAKDGACKSAFNIGGASCQGLRRHLSYSANKTSFNQVGLLLKRNFQQMQEQAQPCSSDGRLYRAVLERKNSWGNDWGENGYIRLAKGDTCGVCQDASFPTAAA